MIRPSKKLLFIIPPYFDISNYISKQLKARVPIFTLPTGILSMAAYVRAHSKYDVQFKILDLNRETYKMRPLKKAKIPLVIKFGQIFQKKTEDENQTYHCWLSN